MGFNGSFIKSIRLIIALINQKVLLQNVCFVFTRIDLLDENFEKMRKLRMDEYPQEIINTPVSMLDLRTI